MPKSNFQSAVASQLRRHVHDVVMAGDCPSQKPAGGTIQKCSRTRSEFRHSNRLCHTAVSKQAGFPFMISCVMRALCMQRNQFSKLVESSKAQKTILGKAVLPRVGWMKCRIMCRKISWPAHNLTISWLPPKFCCRALTPWFAYNSHCVAKRRWTATFASRRCQL